MKIINDKGDYNGGHNNQGKREGIGRIIIENYEKYNGYWKNGMRNGPGI